MKVALVILAALAMTLVVAEPAAATCYIHRHAIDPVARDTGTVVDKVVVYYDHPHCEPPPP